MQQDIVEKLEQRLGRVHARQRLGIEQDNENVFGHGINFFHPENWYSAHSIIRVALKLTGFYNRGHKNAERIQVRHNVMELAGLPAAFDGFTMLHISDMHADMNPGSMQRLIEILPDLTYEICVITGDFRGQTFGPFRLLLQAWQACAITSRDRFMRCSAITTPSGWSRKSKPWDSHAAQ